jgi:hypothetical protein
VYICRAKQLSEQDSKLHEEKHDSTLGMRVPSHGSL